MRRLKVSVRIRPALYHRCPPHVGPTVLAAALTLLGGVASADPGEPNAPSQAVFAEAWVTTEHPVSLSEVDRRILLAEGTRHTKNGATWRVLAPMDALDTLRAAGLEVTVTRPDHRRGAPRDAYHTPDEGHAQLAVLASTSGRAGLVQLGQSVEGRPVMGMWLGQPPGSGAPTWRVLGAHHGDEWSSFEVVLDTAATLVAEDGTDPDITGWLDRSTVWFVPYVNPDGVLEGSRFNANGIDVNRNYGFEWRDDFRAGATAFSEPEARNIRTHAWLSNPHASVSVHAGAANFGYVWNWTTDANADWPLLAAMASDYGSTTTEPNFWVTNGAAWYITYGDTNDWSYGTYGGLDFTLEATATKAPAASTIPDFVANHRPAMLEFLLRDPLLSGRVTDASTGEPVAAQIELFNATSPASQPFYSDPISGSYHRLALAMPDELRVTAPGYAPQTVAAAAQLDIELQPTSLQDTRLDPFVLIGTTELAVPLDSGMLTLWRSDSPPLTYTIDGGVASIDAGQLAPGPYTVELGDGRVWRHGVFVADTQGPAGLSGKQLTESQISLEGAFAPGTSAWTLSGSTRSLVAAPIVDESDTSVDIDLSNIDIDAVFDLILVSDGTWLVIPDVRSDMELDTGSPLDTGLPPDSGLADSGAASRSCGCASSPLPSAGWLAPLVLLILRRRPA